MVKIKAGNKRGITRAGNSKRRRDMIVARAKPVIAVDAGTAGRLYHGDCSKNQEDGGTKAKKGSCDARNPI